MVRGDPEFPVFQEPDGVGDPSGAGSPRFGDNHVSLYAFGGARRCTERAANLYAERGGEDQNTELRLMKAKVSRLEISSASYKRKWRSTREFAESEEAGRRAYLRLQDPRGPGGEPGQTSKRASTGTSHDPGPKTVGSDSPKTAGGDISFDGSKHSGKLCEI